MSCAENEPRFVVRLAGLPAAAVAPFRSEACRGQLERIDSLERQQIARRGQLVAELEKIIGGAPEEQRHFWLALKRDLFNGRGLTRHAAQPLWSATPAELRALFDQVLAGEGELGAAAAEFEKVFAAESRREAEALLPHLGDTRFLRGVALSSGSLTEYLPRLRGRPVADYGRREQRLVSSLLRYLTRAALKLSPFSTLTGVGLGRLAEPPEPDGPQLALAASWQERSQVRMQRYRADQLVALLTRHPPFRAHLPVSLNDTVEAQDADGRFLYLKGPTWDLDPSTGALREAPYSIVTVRLRGPFIEWLARRLQGASLPYGELLAAFAADHPEREAGNLQPTLDRLLEIGFLEFRRLWHTADPYPEERLHEILAALPADPALAPLLANLERILGGEAGFPAAADPFALSRELRQLIRGAIGRAAPLAGYDSELGDKTDHRSLHEDVFVAGPAGSDLAALAVGQYREIAANLGLFTRLSNIRATHVEFLHSAAAFAAEKWPGQGSVPFYDFFEAVNPLFGAFAKHDAQSLKAVPGEAVAFNPFELATLRQLHEARVRLAAELPRCLAADGEEALLDREAVLALLDAAPAAYSRPRDFCALVQPLDDRGSEWVLNLMAEGKGRLCSRFTATMDPAMRQAFAEPFVRASVWTEDGREVELVDIYCSAGHSANVHVPMTRRVFQLPGNSPGLPPERQLRLRDLRVVWGGPGQLPELVDEKGRKILPAHLGAVATTFMPRLVRLLALFGPAGFYFRRPTWPASETGGVKELKRHRIGNVVYRRRTWLVPPAPLAAAVAGLRGGAAVYRHVDGWRRALGMPERVYVHEAIVVGPSPYTKPQYVDFTSPQLVEIFCAGIKAEIPQLQIVEALPVPERQFGGAGGERRALELHLEAG